MAIRKSRIVITGIKDGKETEVHNCLWDGFLDDWMELGGEFGGAIEDFDEIVMTSQPVNSNNQTKGKRPPKVKDNYKGPIKGIVTARTCECCGHHEIGITLPNKMYIPLKPGVLVKVIEE